MHALTSQDARPWRVDFASDPVDPRDPFILHKTTRRVVYENAKRSKPDMDDVLLWNARGEVTESTIANVVAEIDGVRYTPPVSLRPARQARSGPNSWTPARSANAC